MTAEQISSELETIQISPNEAKEYCSELISNASKIESVKQSLNFIAGTDLPNIWQGQNSDVNSIITKLNENVEFLDNLIRFTREFATTLQDYAAAMESNASK